MTTHFAIRADHKAEFALVVRDKRLKGMNTQETLTTKHQKELSIQKLLPTFCIFLIYFTIKICIIRYYDIEGFVPISLMCTVILELSIISTYQNSSINKSQFALIYLIAYGIMITLLSGEYLMTTSPYHEFGVEYFILFIITSVYLLTPLIFSPVIAIIVLFILGLIIGVGEI